MRPFSFAIASCGSSADLSESSATSGWRKSALPSIVAFESSATTWRSAVTINGLISISVASSSATTVCSLSSISAT